MNASLHQQTMDSPKIIIIIVNWNGRRDTIECLESVLEIDYPNFEVIVVDNGSRDDSVQVIQKAFPDVTLLETGENLGFAGGNNVGIRYALENAADYLFLLNNDTIVDPQILNSFIDALTHIGKETILGAKIYYFSEQKRIWYAGSRWLKEISRFEHLGQGCIDDGTEFNALSETDYACGCALFVSAGLLNRIGLLDEKYYLTFEETDLCCRARKAGYKSYFVPEAKVWHKVSISFGGENSPLFHYFLARNRLLWAEKNLSFAERVIIYKRVLYDVLACILPPRFRMVDIPRGSFLGKISASVKEYTQAVHSKFKNPVRKARLRGNLDYFFRRFGNCPESIRSLRK